MLEVFNYLISEYEKQKKATSDEGAILGHLKKEFDTLFGFTDSGAVNTDTTEVFRHLIEMYEKNKSVPGMTELRLCKLIKDEFQTLFWLDEGDKSSPRKSAQASFRLASPRDIDFEF